MFEIYQSQKVNRKQPLFSQKYSSITFLFKFQFTYFMNTRYTKKKKKKQKLYLHVDINCPNKLESGKIKIDLDGIDITL